MKIMVGKAELANALNKAIRCVDKDKNDGILSHVLLDASPDGSVLGATDWNKEVRIGLSAKVDAPGARAIHTPSLRNFVSGAPGETVEFHFDGSRLSAKSGRASAKLPSLDADDFPSMPISTLGQAFQTERDELQRALASVAFCAYTLDDRPHLGGVYVHPEGDSWFAVAINGLSIAKMRFDAPKGAVPLTPFLCPTESVKIAKVFFPEEASGIEAFVTDHTLTLSNERVSFTTRLCAGKFPETYGDFFAPGPHEVSINRDELLGAIGWLSNISPQIGISCVNGAMTLLSRKSSDLNEGHQGIPCDGSLPYEQTPTGQITFDAHLLSGVLSFIPGPNLRIRFGTTNMEPIILTGEDEDYTGLVCPRGWTNEKN